MRLATYSIGAGEPEIGVIVDGGIVGLQGMSSAAPKMIDLIAGGADYRADLMQAIRGIEPVPLDAVRLLAPIPQPPEFLGIGLNYRDHAIEAHLHLPSIPLFFNKQTSCIVGPFDDIVLPKVSEQLDYEGELGIVIGRSGRYLSTPEAKSAIFGYVVVNDLSVRDWQFSSPTHTVGKSFDSHGPFGPWIVTADEVPNPQALTITTRVNEEVRQRGTTADMIFDCCEIVAFLSQVMTLRPGTVISTGTPAGVGLFHSPPSYLRRDDVVTVEIAGIGRLANRVIAERELR
jgi:2-keto-4-pentenoate hydratase/2-oxohepta-3-ene-1,7-dioic acid hydratase in catechol pathway